MDSITDILFIMLLSIKLSFIRKPAYKNIEYNQSKRSLHHKELRHTNYGTEPTHHKNEKENSWKNKHKHNPKNTYKLTKCNVNTMSDRLPYVLAMRTHVWGCLQSEKSGKCSTTRLCSHLNSRWPITQPWKYLTGVSNIGKQPRPCFYLATSFSKQVTRGGVKICFGIMLPANDFGLIYRENLYNNPQTIIYHTAKLVTNEILCRITFTDAKNQHR